MPKEKKVTRNNANKKKANEKEKKELPEKKDDKILDELADSLKKLLDNKDEESELEEDTRLNPDDFEFNNFMKSSGRTSSPVLEEIAGSQINPIFVGGIPQSSNTISEEENESDPFKYVPGKNTNGEPKYIGSDSHMTTGAERVDFNKLGRGGFQPEINQENMFMQSAEAKFESSSQERVWSAERFDADKERRKNPVEREETRYEKYKPDLPKSR